MANEYENRIIELETTLTKADEDLTALTVDFNALKKSMLQLIKEVTEVKSDLALVSKVLSLEYGLFSHLHIPQDGIAEKHYEEMRKAIVVFSEKYPYTR